MVRRFMGRQRFLCPYFAAMALAAPALVPALRAEPLPAPPAEPVEAVEPGEMWELADLFPSPEAWNEAYERSRASVDGLDSLKGTLGESAESMLHALDTISTAQRNVLRVYVYASLKGDEDVRVGENQERQQLAQALITSLIEKTSWLSTEVLEIGAEKVNAFIDASPELRRRFDFTLGNILRAAPHTLGAEAEAVLAAASSVTMQPENIFSQLSNGDLPYPSLTLSDGTVIERLDYAAYSRYRQVPNREDRKKVFDAFWGAWKQYEGTFGTMLSAQIKANEFTTSQRKFPNALAQALFSDNMPEAVYRQLVAQANAGLPVFHRYLRMRAKLLGIDGPLAYYDIYPSMFELEEEQRFSVEDAKAITLEVTSAYGPEYTAMLRRGFESNWMNVLPRPGKASGAYMAGAAYDVHPYLLLNHNYDYDSLSTFAHEWGHAVHTLLTNATQPFEKADYSTFIAETASIANEMLLNDYMVAHAKTKAEKLYYLGEQLELIRGTFFRQTMFAQFQLAIHEEVEQGRALSGERITEIYGELVDRYHGAGEGVIEIDPVYHVEWAFVPHFYYGFYVWQYATSMAGAAAFTEAIQKEGQPAVERFITMLKSGGSDYPYELYKQAGLDMASPAPYEALVARMSRVMDEIDALLAEEGK